MAGEYKSEGIDESGHRIIFRTDDEAEFVRHILEQTAVEFRSPVAIKVNPRNDGWLHVELTYPQDRDLETLQDVSSEFAHMLSIRGKGFYDTRDEGVSRDGRTEWFVVRHRHGAPWY